VLWHGAHEIEFSKQILSMILKHPEKKIMFMSNNALGTRKDSFMGILKHIGIVPGTQDKSDPLSYLKMEDVYNAGYMTAQYLKEELKPKKVLVSGEPGLLSEFERAGINFIS
jgi:ribonucleotide monophosphatase NagD (HAD superfamily)